MVPSHYKLFVAVLVLTSKNAVARIGISTMLEAASQTSQLEITLTSNTKPSDRSPIASKLGLDTTKNDISFSHSEGIGFGSIPNKTPSSDSSPTSNELGVDITGTDISSSNSLQSKGCWHRSIPKIETSAGRNSVIDELAVVGTIGNDISSSQSLQPAELGADTTDTNISSYLAQSEVVHDGSSLEAKPSGGSPIAYELEVVGHAGNEIHWGQPDAWDQWIRSTVMVDELEIANTEFASADREGGLTTKNDNMQPIYGNDRDVQGSLIPIPDESVSLIENSEGGEGNSISIPSGHSQGADSMVSLPKYQHIGENGLYNDYDRCTFIEEAIGMGVGFGIEANCECIGTFTTGLEIKCTYNECAIGSEVCGTVEQNFAFGDPDGTIDVTTCTHFVGNEFEKTCFTYEIDVRESDTPNSIGGMPNSQIDSTTRTCEASYGGQQCECSIEDDICLSVDCSQFLLGGKIDNCQLMLMENGEDTKHWFPHFEIFQPGFQYQSNEILEQSSSSWKSNIVSGIGAVVSTILLVGQIF